MANVIAEYGRPTLVISHNKTLAAQLTSEYRQFFPDIATEFFCSYYDYYQPEAYVPSKDMYIEKETDINVEIEKLRASTTRSLMTREDVVVVASVSCIYNLGDPTEYRELSMILEVGHTIERRRILERLVSMDYERNDMETKQGTFRVRGDVIDIQPGYQKEMVRIQLDGDRIDKISIIEPLTSRRISNESWVDIWPARHHVARQEKVLASLDPIESEMEERVQWFKN